MMKATYMLSQELLIMDIFGDIDSNSGGVARLQKRLADYQATAVPQIRGKDCGCAPVITKGAWRPCDSPNPDGSSGSIEKVVV